MVEDAQVDIGQLYARSRQRLSELVLSSGDAARTTQVAACPGWTVADVVAHLVGVIEDAFAGRLDGAPSDALTAAAVARHRHEDVDSLVAVWERLAPRFEAVLTRRRTWPAMLDVVSHEHDVRAALGQPGFRDDVAVLLGARRLADADGLPAQILIDGDDGQVADDGRPVVRTSAFEVLRFRLGRRSVGQVLALDWSGDPVPIVGALFVFGPATTAVIE